MLSKEPVINAEDEAKVLGLKTPENNIAAAPVQATATKDARM
jgi:hypothetical protein